MLLPKDPGTQRNTFYGGGFGTKSDSIPTNKSGPSRRKQEEMSKKQTLFETIALVRQHQDHFSKRSRKNKASIKAG